MRDVLTIANNDDLVVDLDTFFLRDRPDYEYNIGYVETSRT